MSKTTAGVTRITTTAQTTGIWVRIEREHSPADVWIGPYPSVDAATAAMNEAPVIQGLCETDCIECYVEDTSLTMGDAPLTLHCDECGAQPGEPCRVDCTAAVSGALALLGA